MADKEEGVEGAPRGADWEVVSLTASAYSAAPGPDMSEFKDYQKGDVVDRDKVETSNALFMSGHFVFPPSQHENLPLEPQNTKIFGEQGGEDDATESVEEEGGKSDAKEEDDWSIRNLTGLDDFHGIPSFDKKGNSLPINDAVYAESTTFPGLDLAAQELSIYGSAKLPSFHDEDTMGASNMDDEDRVMVQSLESSDPALDADIPNLPKHPDEDNYDGSGLPYAVWLKKQASSLYAHAKEANTFWSIFIAAAVMGLVILGQQWQQERWQALHHKWQFGINDERMRRMLAPISRFKDATVCGNRRGFSIRSNTSREH